MAALCVVAVLGGLVGPAVDLFVSHAAADTLGMAADDARSSWYPDEAQLAPSGLDDAHFGQLFSTGLDGQVYAQPLVSQGTVLAVTENNSAYGIDATTGTISWHHNYGAAWDPSVVSCGDLTPKIGITATPVIDPATHVAYFTSKVATSADSSTAAYYLHAVNVATGVEQANFPVLIHGQAGNDATSTFNALNELQRPGLALVNGVVYLAFGGHCDHPPYAGWVVGVSTAGAITSLWTDETGQSSGGGAGIWQSGAAPVVDAAGNLYYSTGNGTSPGNGPALGAPQPQGLAECVVKLSTDTAGTNGALSVTDWFCPSNAAQLNNYDGDLGSGGPAQLPASFESGTDNFPMLVVAGKSGAVFLLDMNDLGGVAQGPGLTDRVVSEVGPYGGVWSKPAAWSGDSGYVYLPTASPGAAGLGSSGQLNVFQRVVDGAGHVSLSLVASSSDSFGFSSSSPVITSDGTTPGSGVVWIVHTDDASGVGATLRAYAAVPQAGHLQQLWSEPLGTPGTSSKFNPPAVDNGRVYVGTRDGTLLAFGARAGAPALQANLVPFSPTSLGSSTFADATFTATGPITINSIDVQGPSASTPVFAAGATNPLLPVSLTAGQQLTVPLTFTPSALGLQTGTLTANTDAGAVNLPLNATGTAPTVPIGTAPPSVDFGVLAVGAPPSTTAVTFTNNDSSSFVVTGVDEPGGPFSLIGAPATDGSVSVAPGASIGISVSFTPPATAGNFPQFFDGQLVLHTTVGNVLVPVRGGAAPPAQISIAPTSLKFGSVAVGRTRTLSFTVSNAGGTALTILKSKPPVANRFTATTTLAEGSVIPAGSSVTETVRFKPGAVGTLSDRWLITGNDGSGPQTVHLTGTGAQRVTVPSPSSGGWTLNGSARVSGSALQLTPALTHRVGSAFWPHALSSSALDVSFVETMNGGTGADGITVAFANAASARPTAIGGDGGLLGFGGIPGTAVALHSYPDVGNPAPNSIGIVTGVTASGLHWTTKDAGIPQLRSGAHLVEVHVSNGTMTVLVDGLVAFTRPVQLPSRVYLGFTGSTGGVTDVHRVSSVQIDAGPKPPPVVPPVVPPVAPPSPVHGFRMVGSDGGVLTFDGARYYGSTGAIHLNQPIVGMATDPKTGGYWLVARDGGVFAYHAPFLGSTGGMHLNQPIVGMTATADGRGYWLVARDGGVFTFGTARYHGSTGAIHLNQPIVGMAADAGTGGYWLVARDGGVFAFGAPFRGSAGAAHHSAPIVGMAATASGRGYWIVASNGAVFRYGTAGSFGSALGKVPVGAIVGIAGRRDGRGYWEAALNGAAFGFGSASSAPGRVLNAPIVGIAS